MSTSSLHHTLDSGANANAATQPTTISVSNPHILLPLPPSSTSALCCNYTTVKAGCPIVPVTAPAASLGRLRHGGGLDAVVELLDAEMAAPGALRRLGQRRRQAVHVVAAVTVVAEQQLVLQCAGGGGGRGSASLI